MRRKDRKITSKNDIESILNRALVARVAVSEDNKPYVIPMNFGYQDDCLYLHSAQEGKKIEILRENNNVCFEVDYGHELLVADIPCNWVMKYYSVIGFGKAFFIDDLAEKRAALDIIMHKYAHESSFEYPLPNLKNTCVIKVKITAITGKESR